MKELIGKTTVDPKEFCNQVPILARRHIHREMSLEDIVKTPNFTKPFDRSVLNNEQKNYVLELIKSLPDKFQTVNYIRIALGRKEIIFENSEDESIRYDLIILRRLFAPIGNY